MHHCDCAELYKAINLQKLHLLCPVIPCIVRFDTENVKVTWENH